MMRVAVTSNTPQPIQEELGFCSALTVIIQKIWDFFFSCCCPWEDRPHLTDHNLRQVQNVQRPLPQIPLNEVDTLVSQVSNRLAHFQEILDEMAEKCHDIAVRAKEIPAIDQSQHEITCIRAEIVLEEGEYYTAAREAVREYLYSIDPQSPPNLLLVFQCSYQKNGLWAFGPDLPMSVVFKIFDLKEPPQVTLSEFFRDHANGEPLSEHYSIHEIQRDSENNIIEVKILGTREAASLEAKKTELEALQRAATAV